MQTYLQRVDRVRQSGGHMKNTNINIKTVLDIFGESEKCIMHGNTSDVEIKEIFFSNDDLDKLIGKYPNA